MKPLKERRLWKVLIGIIAGLAVVSVIIYVLCSSMERSTLAKNQKAYKEAKDAGYDAEFRICERQEPVVLEGVSYVHYIARWSAFIDGSYKEELLIKEDDSYIDESGGKTEGLVIYGKVTGFQNDPKDEVLYDPGKYTVVKPYKIAVYQESVDMWAVVAMLVIVAMVEMILVVMLALYFVIYFVKKKQANINVQDRV